MFSIMKDFMEAWLWVVRRRHWLLSFAYFGQFPWAGNLKILYWLATHNIWCYSISSLHKSELNFTTPALSSEIPVIKSVYIIHSIIITFKLHHDLKLRLIQNYYWFFALIRLYGSVQTLNVTLFVQLIV